MTKLEWAKEWSRRGFSVIPVHYIIDDNGACSCRHADCPSPGKHPAVKSWVAYQKRKPSPDTIESWFEPGGKYENYNLGVVTGKVSGNVGVTDVDVGEGKEGAETMFDLQMQQGELEPTLEQYTGSGGIHYFHYAPPDVELATGTHILGPDVDYRGEGGFVVVAPSNHVSGGQYRMREGHTDMPEKMPEWMLRMVTKEAQTEGHMDQPQVMNRWGELTDGREGYMVTLLIGCIRTSWAEQGKIPGVNELIEEAWPVYEKKCAARGKSLDEDGRGQKLMEKKADYLITKAMNKQLKVLDEIEPGSERKENVIKQSKIAGDIPKLDKKPLKLTDHWLKNYLEDPPERKWLVENRIPLGISCLVAGQGGVGKSFTLLDFALKVAGGDQAMHVEKAFGGEIKTNGVVVYITAEDSRDVIHRRIASLDSPTIRQRAKDKLIIVPLPDLGGPSSFIAHQFGTFGPTQEYLDLRKQLIELDKEHDLVTVIVDPMQPFTSADINADPAAAQYFWSMFNELSSKLNATVIVSHHMRKEGSFSIKKPAEARLAIRGTGALVDGCRLVIAMWLMPEHEELVLAQRLGFETGTGAAVNIAIVKANDMADMTPLAYIRAENGLLEDRTPEVMEILDDSTTLESSQIASIFGEVRTRWTNDNPFSSALNTPRSFVGWLKSEYQMSHYAAKKHQQSWLNQGYLEDLVFSTRTNTKGIRVKHLPGESYGRDIN